MINRDAQLRAGVEPGAGLLLGGGLVALTFGLLVALGVYRFEGVNPFSVMVLVPANVALAYIASRAEQLFDLDGGALFD